MHKLFLTEPECSIIRGADKIIEEFGGFPSMENGKLSGIYLVPSSEGSRFNVALQFDIEGWHRVSSHYFDLKPLGEHRRIQLSFYMVSDIEMDSRPFLYGGGEVKFGNSPHKKDMYQDIDPRQPIIVERPFCTFYMRSGYDLVLHFSEEECVIEAKLI